MIDPRTASAVIDHDAFTANIAALKQLSAPAQTMVVVKADAYGHGMIPCARTARAAGAEWLGTATPAEAVALREAGDTDPILCWLYGIDEDLSAPIARDIDVTVSTATSLRQVTTAASLVGRRARVHLKIDTGLSRNGATPQSWPALCADAAAAQAAGAVEVVGVWSHFAASDEPGHPSVARQLAVFDEAVQQARAAGLTPTLLHHANSAAAMILPEARFDLVRLGIAAYGIDPAPGIAAQAGVELRPVMTLRAQAVQAKSLPAGAGVSYGHTWTAPADTHVLLVPLGYADGIPRVASSVAEVWVGEHRAPLRGRVCMDQFVVESEGAEGDEIVLFGAAPAPTAADWAEVCGTIGYEIVTRIGTRVPRVHRGGQAHTHGR